MQLERLTERSDFLALRRGSRAGTDLLTVQLSRGPAAGRESVRVGITVTKKVGNAVVRNRIKRRLRAAVRELGPVCELDLHGRDLVVVARRGLVDATFQTIREDLRRGVARALQPRGKGRTVPSARPPAP